MRRRLQELMRPRRLRAFTLVELLVVMAIIATLLTVAVPRYLHSADRARDAALRQTLAAARDAIDKYYGDTGRYPETLQQLVDKQYLRRAPYDPVTQSETTWVVVPPGTDRGGQSGVYDVRSGAPGNGYDGSAYADW
jgi:general secretion pathway protein G